MSGTCYPANHLPLFLQIRAAFSKRLFLLLYSILLVFRGNVKLNKLLLLTRNTWLFYIKDIETINRYYYIETTNTRCFKALFVMFRIIKIILSCL